MNSFLLDTNALSEFVRSRGNKGFSEWFKSVSPEQLFISCISIGEIVKGAHLAPNQSRQKYYLAFVDELIKNYGDRVITIDTNTCLLWGEAFARGRLNGKTPQVVDSLIAALAVQHNLTLVTRNIKDFEHFSDLKVLNPWLVTDETP